MTLSESMINHIKFNFVHDHKVYIEQHFNLFMLEKFVFYFEIAIS